MISASAVHHPGSGRLGTICGSHPHADKLLECGSRYGPENPKALSGGMLANPTRGLSRREMLSILAKGALAYPLAKTGLYGTVRGHQTRESQAVPPEWRLTDDELLEEIVSRAFVFFWNEPASKPAWCATGHWPTAAPIRANRQHRRDRLRPGCAVHRAQARLSAAARDRRSGW